jgi:hypothetical protein
VTGWSRAYLRLQALDEELPSFELVSSEEIEELRHAGILWQ